MIYITNIDELNLHLKNDNLEYIFTNPPNSILYLGLGYIKTLIDMAIKANPNRDFKFICNCGDDGATAHTAMRLGIKNIKFTGSLELRNKLISVATKLNCKIHY